MGTSATATCRAPRFGCLVALTLLTASVVTCSYEPPGGREPRALLIGIDGATNRVIQPMMESGELPHFAEIARTGTTGILRPDYPPLSPRIWTSAATGKKPERHGFGLGTEQGQMPGVHDSDEARDGILYMRERGVPSGLGGSVLQMNDLAPTLLAWLVLGHAEDMDGRPAEFLRLEIPPPVATYETTPIERVGEPLSGAEEVIIDQLRELGYVE